MCDADPRESLLSTTLTFGARYAAERQTDGGVVQDGAVEKKGTLEHDGEVPTIRERVPNDLAAEPQFTLCG
jgi:hypothetical protein